MRMHSKINSGILLTWNHAVCKYFYYTQFFNNCQVLNKIGIRKISIFSYALYKNLHKKGSLVPAHGNKAFSLFPFLNHWNGIVLFNQVLQDNGNVIRFQISVPYTVAVGHLCNV